MRTHSELARGAGAPPARGADRGPGAYGMLADLGVAALTLWYLATLAHRVAGAKLQSDECFHATLSEWVAAHGTLPSVVPGLYSGFYDYYPPLFHVLGGLWIATFGTHAFRFLNVAISAALVATIVCGCRALGARWAGRYSALLCMANAWLSLHAVRLYVEQLTTLLAAGAFLLVLAVRRSTRARNVAALGAVTGLALIAKPSSLALIALLPGLAVAYALRRQRNVARGYAIAAAIALVLASPMFIRNQVYYGSPIYPVLSSDVNPLLYAMNRATFTPDPLTFYRQTAVHTGFPIGLIVLLVLVLSLPRRRRSLETGLLAFCVALYVAGPLQPFLDPRHMLPVSVVSAVLGCIVLERWLGRRSGAKVAVAGTLAALAVHAIAYMPHDRADLDLPHESAEAFDAVQRLVPDHETVLSLPTYDTFYYSRRAATWPIPWGQQEHPVEMFLTGDCDSVMLALEKYRLRYVLLDLENEGSTFNGANYPRSFVECVSTLLAQHRFDLLWSSEQFELIRVSAARPARRRGGYRAKK